MTVNCQTAIHINLTLASEDLSGFSSWLGISTFARHPLIPKIILNHESVPGVFFMSLKSEPMFSRTIMHCWGTVNQPSAGNFSNEVNGDCSWNPERSLCHCSSCEATGEEAAIFIITCFISMHCFLTQSASELVPIRGRGGWCHIYTLLWLFSDENIFGETYLT